jgi:antitoxin VapB
MQRPVKLIRIDGRQIVEIPPEFELAGSEAVMTKSDGRLIIEQPARRASLLAYLATSEPIEDEFPVIDDPPAEPVDL